MKLLKYAVTSVFAMALLTASSFAPAAEEHVQAACCKKAADAGKTCDHKCCVAAAKEGKECEKCGGKGAVPKKEEKKAEAAK